MVYFEAKITLINQKGSSIISLESPGSAQKTQAPTGVLTHQCAISAKRRMGLLVLAIIVENSIYRTLTTSRLFINLTFLTFEEDNDISELLQTLF